MFSLDLIDHNKQQFNFWNLKYFVVGDSICQAPAVSAALQDAFPTIQLLTVFSFFHATQLFSSPNKKIASVMLKAHK
jgi:uncharacterized phage-like protein YoqJ